MKPTWATSDGSVRLFLGDSRTTLASLEPKSVQCCVTSPPYWGLRQYLFDKAVILRYDLDEETRARIIKELDSRGIKPRQSG